MSFEEVTAFKARDGKLFETADEAKKHNAWLDVLDRLPKSLVVGGRAAAYQAFSTTYLTMLDSVANSRVLTSEDVMRATDDVPRFAQRCAQVLNIELCEFKRRVKAKEITLDALLIAFAG